MCELLLFFNMCTNLPQSKNLNRIRGILLHLTLLQKSYIYVIISISLILNMHAIKAQIFRSNVRKEKKSQMGPTQGDCQIRNLRHIRYVIKKKSTLRNFNLMGSLETT